MQTSDFGVFIYPFHPSGLAPSVRPYVTLAQRLEELGFRSVAIGHLTRIPPSTEAALGVEGPRPTLIDPLLLLPVIAAATRELRLGLHAAAVSAHHPYHWARFFAALDSISGGRVDAGMCIGVDDKDIRATGGTTGARGAMADEAVALIKRLWTQSEVTHRGRFFNARGASIEPKPVQTPHPPIWWGGGLPAIPRAARYCDYILPYLLTPSEVQNELVPRLRCEAEKWGRPVKIAQVLWIEITDELANVDEEVWPIYERVYAKRSSATPWGKSYSRGELSKVHAIGTSKQVAQRLQEFHESGVSHMLLDFSVHGAKPLGHVHRQLDLFVDRVMPLFRKEVGQ
ncbi:MAG: LLM class flavin-dependent oxidoreductase [Dehalococcoidia bacterium]